MFNTTPYLFWPGAIGPYEKNLQQLTQQLVESTQPIHAVQAMLAEFPIYPTQKHNELRFRAYLYVLLDLLRQEWKPIVQQGRLYLHSPRWVKQVRGTEAIEQHKQSIRQSLSWERNAQFQQPAVKAFIRKMETAHAFGGNAVSIRSLIADGSALAEQLQTVLRLNEQEQLREICSVVQPYLQLVRTNERCKYTGLYLQDIWRYFRYMWSTPYNATPGRQMFYLIRDAAQVFHPVIGIAALGNSLVQLTVRDDIIGWTPQAFAKRIMDDTFSDRDAQVIDRMLNHTLMAALNDIDTSDLVTSSECNKPTPEVIERLQKVENDSRNERINWLQKKRVSEQQPQIVGNQLPLVVSDFQLEPNLPSPGKCTEQAINAMYRAKRAHTLWQLLGAKMVIDATGYPTDTADGLRLFWRSEGGQRSIRTLLRENKKGKVGINLMDIIICGAVPPYNSLLGGKLVAMLLTGPQTVQEYAEKYSNHASNIASQLKGEAVVRTPELVFLGTTSLYASNSSQYNRITIPVNEKEIMRFLRYGLTKGYGSVHFSAETRSHLANLLTHANEARLINNRFGEGVNPKLRHVSAGLAAIGLTNVDNFIRHRSQRIVYGIPLCRNSYAYLRGEDSQPDYYFSTTCVETIETQMKAIADFWRKRWFLPRIRNQVHLQELATFDKTKVLLSASESQQAE